MPVFVKQLGRLPLTNVGAGDFPVTVHLGADLFADLRDKKGGDLSEWPEDLRVRQFPEVPDA